MNILLTVVFIAVGYLLCYCCFCILYKIEEWRDMEKISERWKSGLEEEMQVRTITNETEDFELEVTNESGHLPGSIKWLQETLKECRLEFTVDCCRPAISLVPKIGAEGMLLAKVYSTGVQLEVSDDQRVTVAMFNVQLAPNARAAIYKIAKNAKKVLEAKLKEDDTGGIETNV